MLMVVFLLGIVLLMLLIIKFKINPFLALIFTAIVIGFSAGLPVQKIVSNIASGFGGTMGGIGIVIALGIILGQLLYETGGTEGIASLALKKIGVKNSPVNRRKLISDMRSIFWRMAMTARGSLIFS